LIEALGSIHARLRGAADDPPFSLDAKSLEEGDHVTFITDLGDLDCLGIPAGTLGYDDLMKGAVTVDLDGLIVAVASIDDLIRIKRAAGRPRDPAELEILGALREESPG
jgi:hypothetical protein